MSEDDGRPCGIELAIVVPTFNERENISELIGRLRVVLAGIEWELVVVDDDSPDGTAEWVRATARSDLRVRCLQRVGRRGLSSACIEGFMASSADVLLVIDGDLQHDEAKIPEMLQAMRRDPDTDIVVCSRYADGGRVRDWEQGRARASQFATRLARSLCRTDVSDPLSGYFMLRRKVLEDTLTRLSGAGFKILLDIIFSVGRPLRIAEVPYTFRGRVSGESKMDLLIVWQFGLMLLEKALGKTIPIQFISFGLIGALGFLVHLSILRAELSFTQLSFLVCHAIATIVAMTFNFSLNNLLTYRDRRLKRWAWLKGLGIFYLACGIGAIANVGVANFVFTSHATWISAASAGIAIGVVWNYAVTQMLIWNAKQHPRAGRLRSTVGAVGKPGTGSSVIVP